MHVDDTRLKSQILPGLKRHNGTPTQKLEVPDNQSTFTGDQQKSSSKYWKHAKKHINKLSKFKDVMIEDYESQKPTSDVNFKSE